MFSTQDVKGVCFRLVCVASRSFRFPETRDRDRVGGGSSGDWLGRWTRDPKVCAFLYKKKKQTKKQRTKQKKQSLDKYHSYLILTGVF